MEVQDAGAWIERNLLTLEHMIALVAIGEVAEFGIVRVPTHLFDKYYADIAIELTQSKRVSLNSIYNLIKLTYNQSNQLEEVRRSCVSDISNMKHYQDLLPAIYSNTAMLSAQINYHVSQGEELNIYSLNADDAKKLDNEISEKINSIIKNAKSLKKEEIYQKYHRD